MYCDWRTCRVGLSNTTICFYNGATYSKETQYSCANYLLHSPSMTSPRRCASKTKQEMWQTAAVFRNATYRHNDTRWEQTNFVCKWVGLKLLWFVNTSSMFYFDGCKFKRVYRPTVDKVIKVRIVTWLVLIKMASAIESRSGPYAEYLSLRLCIEQSCTTVCICTCHYYSIEKKIHSTGTET